jgi:hypothetical protein
VTQYSRVLAHAAFAERRPPMAERGAQVVAARNLLHNHSAPGSAQHPLSTRPQVGGRTSLLTPPRRTCRCRAEVVVRRQWGRRPHPVLAIHSPGGGLATI